VDETSVPVQGRWNYLYRAVDRDGKSVHSLLSEDRTIASAQEFFRQAVKVTGSWPEKINLDGNVASHRGLRLLSKEDPRWQSVTVRARRYLNNIIEQDHRVIKRRLASMLALKSFRTAAITFSGIELAHRIHKRQFAVAYQQDGRPLSLKQLWDQALSSTTPPGLMEKAPPPLTHQNCLSHSKEQFAHVPRTIDTVPKVAALMASNATATSPRTPETNFSRPPTIPQPRSPRLQWTSLRQSPARTRAGSLECQSPVDLLGTTFAAPNGLSFVRK
jgi:hypothetical protein